MTRRTFGAAFAAGGNNLDLMRLGGAWLVLASHSWVLTGHADDEPFARAMAGYADGGALAVAMFFVISGFLIARSALAHSPGGYLRARALRIFPAFAVAVLLQTFVLGPAATQLGWRDYLGSPAVWDAAGHGLLLSPRLGLPGVFEANPLPFVVNGSLWTLRIEALCYIGLLGLALMGGLRRGWVLLAVAGAFGALGLTVAARAGLATPGLATLRVTSVVDCGVNFVMGAALWCYRDRVPRRWWLAAAGLAALAAGARTWAAPILFHLALPYLVLWLALSRPVVTGLLRRTGDISYGTYLYAFPIQQVLIAVFGLGMGPLGLIAAATPLALGCGTLSRRLVERPALRLRERRAPLAEAAVG